MLSDIKAAWAAGSQHNITLVAAGIAHYLLLAMVPTLGALVLGYGIFADPMTVSGHIERLSDNLPQSAAQLISDQLTNVSEGADGAKGLGLIASLAVALIGARGAANALMTGLNIAFEVDQSRGLVRGNLVALAITATAIVALIVLGAGSAALATIGGFVGAAISLTVLLGASALGAALLYRFAPNRRALSWGAIWPGAAFFALGWIAATGAFGFYAASFASYNATYGSLGAVVVLITWFYVSALFLLLGAELAAVKGAANHDSPQ